MDTRLFVLFAIPAFVAPIVLDLLVSRWQRRERYRANDLTTNLSLSMLSTSVGLAVTVATLGIYQAVHTRFAALAWPVDSVATWLLAFVAYDFLYYCAHRCHHRIALLWAAHVVHHSGEDMNFGLALRQSLFGEVTIWIFFLPMALLGIPPEVYLAIAGLQLLYQYSIHNTYVPALGWLEKVFVTPSQHRVHHGRNGPYIDKNYGNVLVVWDRMFGTYQPERREEPVAYGLRTGVNSWNPLVINLGYFAELFGKFRRCRGTVDKARALFYPPDWRPAYFADRDRAHKHDGASAPRKYDPAIPSAAARYGIFQLLVMLTTFVTLLWNITELSWPLLIALSAFLLATAVAMAGIFEGRRWVWYGEFVRLGGALGLATVIVAADKMPMLVAAALVVYGGLSSVYLYAFRRHFRPAI